MTAKRLLGLLAAAVTVTLAASARAETQFEARAETDSATLGDSLVVEVTLAMSGGQADGYRAPEFRGFRVLGEYPSHSTQIQMGGGASVMRTVYSWRYEVAPTQSGRLTIGPARVRAGGRELRTQPITINVASGALSPPGRPADPQPPAPVRRRLPRTGANALDDLFRGPPDDPFTAPVNRGNGMGSLIRAAADKRKAYVGEQVVVEWHLLSNEPDLRFQPLAEPRTDGFWSESLQVPKGGQGVSTVTHEGRLYIAQPMARKALFPLAPGNLTVTPWEGELYQVDFFGRRSRGQHLRSGAIDIQVVPLPADGRPAGFDPAAVGRFSIEARVDRDQVAVGDALSLYVTITGQGNLRKLEPPPLPALPAFRSYQPKADVRLDGADGVSGRKTVEHLLQAQRPGTITIPAFELGYFDPAQQRYQVARSAPVQVVVTGEARPGVAAAAGPAAAAAAPGPENTLAAEIRPLRARATLARDLGGTFYGSAAFRWALLLPPVAFLGVALADRVRARSQRDDERGRRRRTRRLIRHHLRAAEDRLRGGDTGACFMEISRVLGEVLAARLGQPVAGLHRAELGALLASHPTAALPPALVQRTLAALDECDQARFAPAAAAPDRRAALDAAADLIEQIERAPVKKAGAAA
jgi:hypothetical protein